MGPQNTPYICFCSGSSVIFYNPLWPGQSKGLPTPRLTAGQEDSHQAALRRSNRLLQTCISSLVSTLKCSIFLNNFKYFFHSCSHDQNSHLLVLCKAGASGMHNQHASRENNIEIHQIRCFAYGADLSHHVCAVSWPTLTGTKLSTQRATASAGLAAAQTGVWLVNRRRGDGAASQGRDLSGRNFSPLKGKQKFGPGLLFAADCGTVTASQRGPGGGAATVEFDWTKKKTLTNKRAGWQAAGPTGLKGLYLDVRSLRHS